MVQDQQQADKQLISQLIQQYIRNYGCGDSNCATCMKGVAIELKELDAAFNAGYMMALQDHHSKK